MAIRLILACLRLEPEFGTVGRIQDLSRAVRQWPDFLEWVSRHRAAPLVYRNLRDYGGPGVPDGVLAALRSQVEGNTRQALVNATELIRLISLFQKHGIGCLPLKGSVLALQVYGDLSCRHAGDIDLWVEPDCVDLAERLLEPTYRCLIPGFSLTPAQRRRFLRICHHCKFVHRQGTPRLELHWRPIPHYFSRVLDGNRLYQRATSVTLAGTALPALSLAETLVYLCAHGGTHFWSRLFWLADLAEIVRQQRDMDWQQVAALAQEAGLARQFNLGLLLAQALLDAPLPAQIQAQAAADPLLPRLIDLSCRLIRSRDIINPPMPLKIRQNAWKFINAPTLAARLSFLQALLSGEGWQKKRFPDSGYLLYYLVRLPLFLQRRLPPHSQAPPSRHKTFIL